MSKNESNDLLAFNNPNYSLRRRAWNAVVVSTAAGAVALAALGLKLGISHLEIDTGKPLNNASDSANNTVCDETKKRTYTFELPGGGELVFNELKKAASDLGKLVCVRYYPQEAVGGDTTRNMSITAITSTGQSQDSGSYDEYVGAVPFQQDESVVIRTKVETPNYGKAQSNPASVEFGIMGTYSSEAKQFEPTGDYS